MTVEYKVVNPATGAVEKKFPTATDAEIAAAVGRSDEASARGAPSRSPSGAAISTGSPTCTPSASTSLPR